MSQGKRDPDLGIFQRFVFEISLWIFSVIQVIVYLKCYQSKQLDLPYVREDVSPLIQEASSVPNFLVGSSRFLTTQEGGAKLSGCKARAIGSLGGHVSRWPYGRSLSLPALLGGSLETPEWGCERLLHLLGRALRTAL